MKNNIRNLKELEMMLSELRPRSASPEVKELIEASVIAERHRCEKTQSPSAILLASRFIQLARASSVVFVAFFLFLLIMARPSAKTEITFAFNTNKHEFPIMALSNQNLITFCVGSLNNEHNILTTPLFKWTNHVVSN